MYPVCTLRELKHLGQNGEYRAQVAGTEHAEPLAEPLPINGAHLIERNTPVLAAEPTDGPERVCVPASRHWRDDHCLQMVIQLVGRDNETGTSFANLAAASGIEFDEHDFTAADQLFPHPVYATQSWASIVNPGERTSEQARRLLIGARERSAR